MRSTTEIGTPQEMSASGDGSHFDWKLVNDPLVATALKALLVDWRMKKRWNDFPAAHRRLHIHILQTYLATGDAPAAEDLNAKFGSGAVAGLADLADRDLVVLRGGEITGAYPFTSRNSAHAVEIGGREIKSMCAIDAFGAGAMAGSNAQVHARCPECDTKIDICICQRRLKNLPVGRSKSRPVWVRALDRAALI